MIKKLVKLIAGGYRLVDLNDIYEMNGKFSACFNRLKAIDVDKSKLSNSVEKDQVLHMLKQGKRIIKKYNGRRSARQ